MDPDKTKKLISFPNELAKQINPASLRSAKSVEIRFSFCAQRKILFLQCNNEAK